MIPKPSRIRDPKLLASMRGQPCAVCGRPGEPHHLTSRGAGGSDTAENVKPLCHACHMSFHAMGRYSFCEKHGLDWFVRP